MRKNCIKFIHSLESRGPERERESERTHISRIYVSLAAADDDNDDFSTVIRLLGIRSTTQNNTNKSSITLTVRNGDGDGFYCINSL